ncbi:hypothetical protein [Bradyrhizobium sp. CB3481]|uniref:hypothetical protein n=1 Tax=Bradyrhizobium sp. CB3481 TaxID=3039158 RepID=UPI0024B1A9AB|nr:hypothetical protein [Bradyrhizobium sp. CB3481]WFU17974.1 hypothetical protein QA643_06410 [Bradyrhizobium sp. CB3481]
MKAISAAILLAQALSGAAFAQARDKAPSADRPLLATFCDAGNIKGSACTRAKNYRSGKRCDVRLQPDRHSGKFLADGTTLLAVNYESNCEPHATDFGGSVVFEQKDGNTTFKGYQPGLQVNDCITVARNEKQDRLICITGHIGQGHLESGVAEMVFTRDFSGTIDVSLNYFVTGEDAVGAYGANVVECKETSKYFGFAKLGAGLARDTVTVEIAHADKETIGTACGKGFPKPKETFGELGDGEAYVPQGFEKKTRIVIDLTSSKAVPEADFTKP